MRIILTSLFFILLLIMVIQPCYAVTKCYKDICVGQTVIVNSGIYKGNKVRILDIIKERTPDEDEAEIRDFYKYFVSFEDGTTLELYKEELR